jgi:membrane protease YdiL (CAAX protease family)
MGTLVFNYITILLLRTLIKSEIPKSYSDFLKKNQIDITFIGPIIEELIFRGAVLPLSLLTIGLLFPASLTTPFFGLGISMAAACALIISSVSFGLVHYSNGGKNHLQVINSALCGIVYGLLSLQFGLITAIGAHIFNNFFITAISNLAPEPKKPKEEENLGLQPSMA